MRDFKGRKLKVGDNVAFINGIDGYQRLEEGVVNGFTGGRIRIKTESGNKTKIREKVTRI